MSLHSNIDERGFFIELSKSNNDFFEEGIGQISHSFVKKDIIKSWHAHKFQTQWNYVVRGKIDVVLIDGRENSETYKNKISFQAGEGGRKTIYKFPPGVLHGYKCIKNLDIIYITSGQYDLDDEIRVNNSQSTFFHKF